MTHRHPNHTLEDRSLSRLITIFSDQTWTAQQIFRDYGEDLIVRICENDVATPYYFFVQVKSTTNIENHIDSSGRVEKRVRTVTARGWAELAQPLFLMLWDEPRDRWYWCHAQTFLHSDEGRSRMSRDNGTVAIPLVYKLTASSLPALISIVREVTIWSTKAYQAQQLLLRRFEGFRHAMFGMAALVDISGQEDGGLLLIEEPENGLRPTGESQELLRRLEHPATGLTVRIGSAERTWQNGTHGKKPAKSDSGTSSRRANPKGRGR